MKLLSTKRVTGAVLALVLTSGGALAASRPGETWRHAEQISKSTIGVRFDLHPPTSRREPAARKLAALRSRCTAGPKRVPDIEIASCAGGRASLLCPGYQLIGFEF